MARRRAPSQLTVPLQIGVAAVWLIHAVLAWADIPTDIRAEDPGPFLAGFVIAGTLFAAGILLRWRWLFYYSLIGFALSPASLLLAPSAAGVAFDLIALAAAIVMLVASSYYSTAWAMVRYDR